MGGPSRFAMTGVFKTLKTISVINSIQPEKSGPLEADEVINCFRNRWQSTYDVQLVVRNKRLYFQVMWGYLEQQSFPKTEETYRTDLSRVVEVVNRLGLSSEVREWLLSTPKRPRLGRALSLHLRAAEALQEFVL